MSTPLRKPWFLRGRLRYIAALALAIDLGTGVFSTAMAVAASSPVKAAATTAPTAPTSSAVTVKWTDGRSALDAGYQSDTALDPSDPNQPLYKNLQVTVSQTKDLTDQGLAVSWSGGVPTSPGGAASDYLQIMQCWASAGASGPSPEQCQWGTPNAALAAQMGTAAATRSLLTGDEADPKQSLGPDYTHAQYGYPATNSVPFWSADDPGKKHLTWTDDQYDLPPFGAAQSNEVTYARTAADGTGQYIVSLQSALSAPYLGCGNPTYAAQGKSCWLVIVPRGEYNLNGAKASQHDTSLPQNYNYVAGSPLSASAWQDRIQVRLTFSPIGASCRLGVDEVRTAGSELVSGAFASWQSALCDRGTDFGYSKIGDAEARNALTQGGPGAPTLGFVSSPIDPAAAGGATLAYAPMTTSALVVSYLIDKNYTNDKSNPDIGADGTLVTNLRLTPLLVAKLLTQSYRDDTPGDGKGTYPAGSTPVPASNPDSIRQDPEFLALNPEFKYFYPSSAPDGLIVPFGDTDAAKLLWTWLRSDTATRSFLAGRPDRWGMTINPSYKGLDLANDTTVDSFPKADPSTYRTGDAPLPGYGTLDMRPYAASFTDGAVRTVTASAGQKTFWDITKVPPQYAGGAAQIPGSRFEMAITTSQAAALYGLPVASLVSGPDATDAGVGPTADAMAKELAGASTSTAVPGVATTDPSVPVDGGYPLTMRTYAAINVCAASAPTLTDYAHLLDYVSSGGQVSGTKLGELPVGYAPLSGPDRVETEATAAQLRAEVQHPKCSSHQTSPGSPPTSPGGSSTPPGSPGTTGGTTTTGGSTSLGTPPSVTGPGAAPGGTAPGTSGTPATSGTAAAPGSSVTATADAPPGGITPAAYVSPAARYALLAVLCFALPCLVAGPRLLVLTRQRA